MDMLGGLDILVNNAGILRDRAFANMSEEEWDDVIRIHLRDTPRRATTHWRIGDDEQRRAIRTTNAVVIGTTLVSGLFPSLGQANYGPPKSGIVALTRTLALKGRRRGVRANAVSPSARTRMSLSDTASPGVADLDNLTPESVSPLLVWLALPGCRAAGQIHQVYGHRLITYRSTSIAHSARSSEGDWSVAEIEHALSSTLVPVPSAEQILTHIPSR